MHACICLLFLFSLTGCGVLLPYLYDAQKLQDHLVVTMPREQVLKQLGKPDRVLQDDGQQTIWEYRLYPRGEWAGYLVHCPLFPNCYFPAESASLYYVVLRDNRLCLWGTPSIIQSMARIACGTSSRARKEKAGVSVVPVFMPPLITPLPKRLAIVPVTAPAEMEVKSWLDLTVNFLRARHEDLILVEREDLMPVLEEVDIQYGGKVDDDTTIRLGRLVGADSLLTYRFMVDEGTIPASAAFELRLFRIETGTTVFRQMSLAKGPPSPSLGTMVHAERPDSSARRMAVEQSAAYGLSALTAAFGDNPLGLVADLTWTGEGIRLVDLLQDGPGFRAGLKPGDHILTSNGERIGSWADKVWLPARLTVRRDEGHLEITIR